MSKLNKEQHKLWRAVERAEIELNTALGLFMEVYDPTNTELYESADNLQQSIADVLIEITDDFDN